MRRGEIWWTELGPPVGSQPAKRRPVLIVQSDPFNASRINTVVVAAITSNLRLEAAPGNVRLSRRISRLSKTSVVNVSQIVTLDKATLVDRVSSLPSKAMSQVDEGLRLVLDL